VRAGFLGVDLFMVLSGFLITGLLLDEHRRTGLIRLGAFWARRFRRLVPALVLMLAAVALWLRFVGPAALRPTVRLQGLSALLYITNWKLIHDGVSYASLSSSPSPLLHLWSLAIEEQFYLIWPPLMVLALLVTKGRRWLIGLLAAAGTAASMTLMAVWYTPGNDPLRLYYGTDTRAQAFLIGALAALAVRYLTGAQLERALRVAGPAALATILAAFVFASSSNFLYRGGFGLFAFVAAIAVAASTVPGPVTRILDRGPLRSIGRVSYAIYLWHWPAIVLLTRSSVGFGGVALLALRASVVTAATLLSWVVIERPYARLLPRRAVQLGPAVMVSAAALLVTLPTTQLLAYANVNVDKAPPPAQVLQPDSTSSLPGPPTTLQTTRVLTSIGHLRPGTVLLIGDSGMVDESPALSAGLAAAGWRVVMGAYPGEGATNTKIRALWASQVVQYRPELTIAMLGEWDISSFKNSDAPYWSDLADTVTKLTAYGGKVLWLSMLPGGTTPNDRAPDRFYEQLPTRYPGLVDYYDIQSSLAAANGTWPRVVNGQLYRKPDDWHLCQAGAASLAHDVLGHLGIDSQYWDNGPWQYSPHYNDPPGGCRQ
jgi:peptidoglycan/LPS O-acetylase OafA/YrhL